MKFLRSSLEIHWQNYHAWKLKIESGDDIYKGVGHKRVTYFGGHVGNSCNEGALSAPHQVQRHVRCVFDLRN